MLMKLVFVNIMQELQRFDSTAYITQPPVPLAVLNAATPKRIETALIDEQADRVRFEGDVFAFSVSTQNARAAYDWKRHHRHRHFSTRRAPTAPRGRPSPSGTRQTGARAREV